MATNVRQGEGSSCTVDEAMHRLGDLLPRIVRGLRRNKPAELAELLHSGHLGPRHGRTLYVLTTGPVTVGELAGQLGLSLATTSNLVAELDRAGLVERRQDPADRRRTIVTIAEDRRPVIEAWMTQTAAPFVRALERLDSGERATLIKALGVLVEELGPVPADAAVCEEDAAEL